MGYKETDKDVQIVSELMDDIRDAVTNYQVCGDPRSFLQDPITQATGTDGATTGYI